MVDFNCLFTTSSLSTLALVVKMNDCLTRKRTFLILNNLAIMISFRFRKNLLKMNRIVAKSSIMSRKENAQEDRSNSKIE